MTLVRMLVMALMLMVLSLGFTGGTVSAKITPEACVNGGGQQAPGQQPNCIGSGQTEVPALNPAGNVPPGQQS